MRRSFLFLPVLAGLLFANQSKTFTGVITDDMCGVDHVRMKVSPDPKCVEVCVRGHGSKYALHDGKNLYRLSDQKTPEKFAGKKVKVTGVLYEKTQIIKVESIDLVKP
jgi:hypothetical protein